MENTSASITLRPFKPTDVDDFMIWAGDDRVTRFLRWKTFTSKQEALTFINDVSIPHPCAVPSASASTIAPSASSHLLVVRRYRCRADIGYAIAVKYWGQVKLAISLVFRDLLQAYTVVDKKASQRVMEKTVFQQKGC